jgi:hypothetical protein
VGAWLNDNALRVIELRRRRIRIILHHARNQLGTVVS